MSDMALTSLDAAARRLQTSAPTRATVYNFVRQAGAALAQTSEPREVKTISDMCAAAVTLCRRAHIEQVQVNAMLELLVATKAKLGAILNEVLPDGRPPKDRATHGVFTLRDLNISEHESRQCRKLAAVSGEDLRTYYSERLGDGLISIAGILRMAGIDGGKQRGATPGDVAKWITEGKRLHREGMILAASITLPGEKVIEI